MVIYCISIHFTNNIFYTIAYIRMESKQTISNYINQNGLDDIEIWSWVPIFNLIFLIGSLICWFIDLIGKINKP